MTRQLIRLDAGRAVLAWCVKCPSWREIRPTREAALRAGADHLRLVHDDQAEAAQDHRERAERIARRAER